MRILLLFKTHLISLLCGVVAIAAIVFAVLGMSSGTIVKAMKDEITRTGAGSISNLKQNAKNEEVIAAEKRRGELFDQEYAKTVDEAKRINTREPLMAGVFPTPAKAAVPFEFKQVYKRRMDVLYSELNAGTLPTDVEIQEEAQNVEDLILTEAEQKAEEEGDASGRAPRVASGRQPATRTPRFGEAGGATGRFGGRGLAPPPADQRFGGRMAGPAQEFGGRFAGEGPGIGRGVQVSIPRGGEPKYDPVYRARVEKAKSILCYYDAGTFHVSPIAHLDDAPQPEEMWCAQVGLWVQEDVVRAIAALNQEVADNVADKDACVEDVPVKRLVLIRVLGYETPNGRYGFADALNTPVPPPVPSLTGRKGNEQYDVVRFVVQAVVDQRDILKLIDAISRANFYQCLKVGYEEVNQDDALNQGYFYGTDPVVLATLEFEGYMAREVYASLMPPAVRKILGIDREEG